MPRLLLTYLVVAGIIFALTNYWQKRKREWPSGEVPHRQRFRSKAEKSSWVQVHDTDSPAEARGVLARLEEEEIECILYEQGKKDVHGNSLKRFGVAVPKTSISRAQNVISRMSV